MIDNLELKKEVFFTYTPICRKKIGFFFLRKRYWQERSKKYPRDVKQEIANFLLLLKEEIKELSEK